MAKRPSPLPSADLKEQQPRELAAKTAILVFCASKMSPNSSARIDGDGVNFSSFARQRKKVFAVKILVRSGGVIIMKENLATMKYDTSL